MPKAPEYTKEELEALRVYVDKHFTRTYKTTSSKESPKKAEEASG